MVTDFAASSFLVSEFKGAEENTTIKNITDVIKNNFKIPIEPEEDVSNEYNKILHQATLALKNFSNAYYKDTRYIDLIDIDQIKTALKNYANSDKRIAEFKKELLEDLSDFQKQIKTGHAEKIEEMKKQYRMCKRQMASFEAEKNSLIMERLSKICWPYDAKTKEYDAKIAKLDATIKQYERKIEEAQKMRPMAKEREILLYQMHLKEKYAK